MFKINGTEFGIDEAKTMVNLKKSWFHTIIDIKVHGSAVEFSKLDSDGPWSWCLYPPELYIYGLRLRGSGKTIYGSAELEEVECAIYMMEHNPITELRISRQPNGYFEVSGTAEIVGKHASFELVVPTAKP